ncbi:MAG TPA: hypothetical protein VFZ21_00145 [Gemmatimonadaceae bacterium]|nr:hypothetical protein [Gemmatimonadaceae bacterium]
MSIILSRLVALVCVAGCARAVAASQAPAPSPSRGTAPPQAAAPQSPANGPLAPLVSQPLIVLPVQTLRGAVPAWSEELRDARAYLATLDDEIAFAIRERGLRAKWAFPPDLARAAKRNPTYASDPYAIAIEALAPVEKDTDRLIGEPLAGQLRALAAISGARYAFVPVELRLTPDSVGGVASLRVMVVDTRLARLTWKGDVAGEHARTFSPAIAAGLAGRVADLFLTPSR